MNSSGLQSRICQLQNLWNRLFLEIVSSYSMCVSCDDSGCTVRLFCISYYTVNGHIPCVRQPKMPDVLERYRRKGKSARAKRKHRIIKSQYNYILKNYEYAVSYNILAAIGFYPYCPIVNCGHYCFYYCQMDVLKNYTFVSAMVLYHAKILKRVHRELYWHYLGFVHERGQPCSVNHTIGLINTEHIENMYCPVCFAATIVTITNDTYVKVVRVECLEWLPLLPTD